MRLKSFYAKTMTEAMQMVRDNLGDNAIIVATREENGGRSVRVTAAIEHDDERRMPPFESKSTPAQPQQTTPRGKQPAAKAPEPARAVPTDWLQYDQEEDEEDAVYEYLTDTLLRHGLPHDVLDTLLSTALMMGLQDPAHSLKAALDHAYEFQPMPLKSPRKAFMLIGPPGAGKTLATAKLAARAAMASLKPAVITTDTVRAGGIEQLEAFTKLLQIPLLKARSGKEVATHIDAAKSADLILIDSFGCNPFEVDDMRRLAKLMDGQAIEPVLVMGAGGDAEESAEIARCFAVLGVQRLFPTRLDIARRLGGLLSAATKASLAFTDASNTPMVAGGLLTLTPQSLTTLLLPPQRAAGQTKKNLRETG